MSGGGGDGKLGARFVGVKLSGSSGLPARQIIAEARSTRPEVLEARGRFLRQEPAEVAAAGGAGWRWETGCRQSRLATPPVRRKDACCSRAEKEI